MSLFSALNSAANALSTFQNALAVSQNNVNNSSTPGYARQTPMFLSLPDEQGLGEVGGVTAGIPQDSRDQMAETSVQGYSSSLGLSQQQVESLTGLQNNFDISGTSGVPSALTSLYSAFSSWATTPTSGSTQQGVLTAAQTVAAAFQQTAQQVSQVGQATDTSLTANINQVNQLAARLSGYNEQILAGDTNDPGLNAAIYSTIQALSQYVNVTTISGTSGTINVMLGNGQTPLVDGTTARTLTVSVYVPQPPPPANPGGPPTAHVQDSNGNDITPEITGGSVAGLLSVRNQTLPAIQGDGNQTGSLNQLAQAFADRVNTILTSSVVSTGPPVVNGTALFTYDNTNATNVAASLQVNPAITTQTLAASDGTTANGTALALANLSNSQNAADQVNGQTYTGFFGSIAASVGAQISAATTTATTSRDSLTQAESMRSKTSGVDLNQEAAQIMQFQQGYEAAAKIVSVIDDMTQTALNLITPSSVV
ncbi:MAG TPA: flagellar hook-associated protein FlgK [Bryobacteraceae bacterium]|jgi:flagellar hook-associated protein 1 FlgK|nr:flagellar hook-associated protein FlgK [Bryobacteraceae bacterium]